MKEVPEVVSGLSGRLDEIEEAIAHGKLGGTDWSPSIGALQQRCLQLEECRREDTVVIATLQGDLQAARVEGRQKRAEVEANALKDGEIRVAEYKSELRRQVGTVRMEFDESLAKLRTWTTEKLQTEIQVLWESISSTTPEGTETRDQLRTHLETWQKTVNEHRALMDSNVRSVNSLTEMIEKMGEDWDTRAVADSGMAGYDRVGGIDMAEGSGETIPLVMPSSPPSLTLHPLDPFTTGFGSPVPIQSVGCSHVGASSVTGSQALGTLGVGQLKLEGPTPFKGPGNRPGATKWLEKVATWMELMRYPADEWILICSTRLEGHAASWFSAQRKAVREGERRNWLDFAEFSREFVKAFSPHDEEEAARRDLKELRQLGRVSGYTARFHELCCRIPGMSEKDKFSAYFLGLVPRLQSEVGLRLDTEDLRTVERATQVAQRAEEYLKLKYPKDDKKKNEADKTKKNAGAVHNVEQMETASGS